MILYLGSLVFNAGVETGGNTPSWGTELGQGSDYKFNDASDLKLFQAMLYNAINDCKTHVFCPLGKGGNRQDDYDFVLGSLFKKIYVNGIFVPDAQFILLIIKLLKGDHHVGRRTLKYGINITFDNENVNEDCYIKIRKALGLNEKSTWFINEIYSINQDELHFTAYVLDSNDTIVYKTVEDRKRAFIKAINNNPDPLKRKYLIDDIDQPLQQIFYGAPGTGKSFKIDEMTRKYPTVRTTFHPDSDYSTFVGAYKPVMEDVEKQVVPVVFNNSTFGFDTNNGNFKERCIAYKFVKQAFTKAYLSSWRKYVEDPESPQPQFLVIEEINRGNCAQIFGDLFQLLDRSDNGFSSYPIEADTDLQKEVARSFKEDEEYKLSSNISIEGAVKDYTSNYEATLSEDVQEGRILLLPPNLYIWATMNTSDQSLFPIDSAFKRRWDWVYIPIKNHEEESYKIDIDGAIYDWWGFLEKINNVIGQVTSSEDKKLGYFFVKAPNKVVDAKKFVGKVLFYLWNDVFKNYGFENAIFSKGENKIFTFSEFFDKKGEPETTVVNEFLKKLDETIDKEHSFVSIDNDGSPSSSLIVKYMGEYIEGDTAKSKYIEIIKRVIEEKGVEQVANVIGAELTQTPSDNSREYKPIGDSGWYLVTRIGTRDIIKYLIKIKEQLGVDIVFDRAKEE